MPDLRLQGCSANRVLLPRWRQSCYPQSQRERLPPPIANAPFGHESSTCSGSAEGQFGSSARRLSSAMRQPCRFLGLRVFPDRAMPRRGLRRVSRSGDGSGSTAQSRSARARQSQGERIQSGSARTAFLSMNRRAHGHEPEARICEAQVAYRSGTSSGRQTS